MSKTDGEKGYPHLVLHGGGNFLFFGIKYDVIHRFSIDFLYEVEEEEDI